jgi:hypothetical protein
VRLPDPRELVEVARLKDDAELERVAFRLGPLRLLRLAERGEPTVRRAALAALPLVDVQAALLPDLVPLAADADEALGLEVVAAARRLTSLLLARDPPSEEPPRDVALRAAAAVAPLIDQQGLSAPVRAGLIELWARLSLSSPVDAGPLTRLLADGAEVEVRRAAAEALAEVGLGHRALASALARDPSAQVAAAAAAALCRPLPPSTTVDAAQLDSALERLLAKSQAASLSSGDRRRLGQLLAEREALGLGPEARTRLRALAGDEQLSLADRLDLLGCLRPGATAEDRALLSSLGQRGPEPLRRRARSLGGR